MHSRGTLEFTEPGVYELGSLFFEPDAMLSITGDFDVAVLVAGDIVLGDRFKMSVGGQSTLDASHLFLYSGGSYVEYGFDSAVVGGLEAPLAEVVVRDRTFVRGILGAREMTIGFDAVVGPLAAPEAGSPPPPPPLPGTTFEAGLVVTGNWGTGYCANVVVANHGASPTTAWTVTLAMNDTATYTSWNGNFSAATGTVAVTPGASWNTSIAPGASDDTVGFCANRSASGGTVASVVSAEASY